MNHSAIAKAIAEAYTAPTNGRASVIGDARLLQMLFSELEQGTHLEPACALAGVSLAAVYDWIKRGDAGERPFDSFARAYKHARASAEAHATRNVMKAGDDPRFWAASATYLERSYPDRWARRSESTDGPKVVVQIGVMSADVQVTIVGTSEADLPASLPTSGPLLPGVVPSV